jgi:hypothetical protein
LFFLLFVTVLFFLPSISVGNVDDPFLSVVQKNHIKTNHLLSRAGKNSRIIDKISNEYKDNRDSAVGPPVVCHISFMLMLKWLHRFMHDPTPHAKLSQRLIANSI